VTIANTEDPSVGAVQGFGEQTGTVNRDSATGAQELRILEALRRGKPTTNDLRKLGIYQASARIFGLRRKGYNIATELIDAYDRDGFLHRGVARYSLLGEPVQGAGGRT
jgi:hypothetical protein